VKASVAAILSNPCPFAAKRRGRRVRNYDAQQWEKGTQLYIVRICEADYVTERYYVVVDANYHKFTESEHSADLAEKLLATGERRLGEASTSDFVWGMGCTATRAHAQGRYPGQNLLGKALEEVRATIRNEAEEAGEFGYSKCIVYGG
jgi:ribA/ribD-fused uncharacterized protein